MIELARTQDEEVGDGTTTVIVLAGEMLKVALPFFERNIHPTIMCQGYMRALEDSLKVTPRIHLSQLMGGISTRESPHLLVPYKNSKMYPKLPSVFSFLPRVRLTQRRSCLCRS